MRGKGLAKPIVLVSLLAAILFSPSISSAVPDLPPADPVVVATFDTGTNPFHPCFRRPGTSPHSVIAGFPTTAKTLDLTFLATYSDSKEASSGALESIEDWTLYYIPETNLTFYGSYAAKDQLLDYYPHGSQASSQIGCDAYGMAANSMLVIINWYLGYAARHALVTWAADQTWIDVIHLNIQDFPLLIYSAPEIEYAISKGKMVMIAAGNGVYGLGPNYPMELSRWNGPPGSLIAGANDNGGWTIYSNLNPHVVMDGGATLAAQPYGFGDTSFGGTSSASPRLSGYVARVIGALRREFGHTGSGLVTIPSTSPKPSSGPLADGVLTAAELHEVVRKTASPNPHYSYYDGGVGSPWRFPQPFGSPVAIYPKMGYGEVSEVTIGSAIDVAAGRSPMPPRVEDNFFLASEEIRDALWGYRPF